MVELRCGKSGCQTIGMSQSLCLQSESGRKNCFRIARQMAREGRDVINVCMKMMPGMLCLMLMV